MDYIREFDIRLEKEMYYAGETLAGHIIVNTIENFKLRAIRVQLRGKAHAEWKVVVSGDRRTVKDDQVFIDERAVVWGKASKLHCLVQESAYPRLAYSCTQHAARIQRCLFPFHDVDHHPVFEQQTVALQTFTLAAAVARREQARNALKTASTDAASLATADAGVCSPTLSPPASRSAGQKRGKNRPLWRPQALPKPKATDFVVLKCRTQLSLIAVFLENGAGRAFIARLGATATRLVTVVLVREQNLMLVYAWNPHIADKLIGEFAVPSSVGPVPMFGYLRADTQDSCYGVVTVPNSDNEATLRESLYWPEGQILHVRRLGTSNKVRLTFSGKVKPRCVSYDTLLIPVQPYKKTVPACSRCGSVGHRADICPGPNPDLCGICGKAVPLTDGSCAPHECTPRCARCAGPHVTCDRRCKERYRAPPPKPPTPPPGGQAGPRKRKRQRRRKPRKLDHRALPQGAQPSATNPIVSPHPGSGAIGSSLRGPTPDEPPV
ncbi:hypothetical protein HPB50_026063 [Hyalomma asiaticum]|uniref:Uncharacterized protein n=1 Tax=Hyalomma asiaticum TaxID=266040 RepID=A0ACB7T729_HYAAI|nr:hypothetical protein HPB50_026063 [Hyalomma asiaticum]